MKGGSALSFSLLSLLSLVVFPTSLGSAKSKHPPVIPYLRPPVVDERPRVRGQPAHGAADVLVDLGDLFDARGDEQGRRDALLRGEDDALLGAHADRGGAELCEEVFVWFWGGGERRKRW